MASLETVPLVSDLGNSSNYARITCLLMCEGTDRMKTATMRHLPARKTLAQVLAESEVTFKFLRRKGIVSKTQYEMLFPFGGDMAPIDMSLWMILARNVTDMTYRRGVKWYRSPGYSDVTWCHDLLRLREIRNYLFHASSPELTDEKFEEIKRDLVAALKRLGSDDVTIETLLSRDLDPQKTTMYMSQLKQQYMEEKWMEVAQRKRHTKMLITVLVVLSILVAGGIAIAIYWFTNQKTPCSHYIVKVKTTSGVVDFMPRRGWKARPHSGTIPRLQTPVKQAVVHHTAMVHSGCDVTSDCCDVMRWIQNAQMDGKIRSDKHWKDIAYNYLIGDDGVVYEGRGAQYQGEAVWHRNQDIISIALMGNYVCVIPSRTALMALYVFLEYIQRDNPGNTDRLIKSPILAVDYQLHGHCQVYLNPPEHDVRFPDSPGAGTMGEIMFWKHWDSTNVSRCDIDKDCLASYNTCKKPRNSTWASMD